MKTRVNRKKNTHHNAVKISNHAYKRAYERWGFDKIGFRKTVTNIIKKGKVKKMFDKSIPSLVIGKKYTTGRFVLVLSNNNVIKTFYPIAKK